MSRTLPALAATSLLALAAFALPMAPAHATGPFDGTWIIDVPADTISGADDNAICPALRLRVHIIDGQVTGQFRRSFPEDNNVVETGGSNGASQVNGNVQPDGALTAQWQNFHAAGQMGGDRGHLTMQSECGPLQALARRLDGGSMAVTTAVSSVASADQATASQTASAATNDAYNVYFNFDRSKLTATGQGVVTEAVNATHGSQTSRIAIVGKADLAGTDPYNMALSQRRADRVRDAMVAGGVPANRIDVKWVGDRQPPVATAPGVRDAQNRVVEVAID
jgi:outer membrane protein OmpA-like peptidoglycan-associated protein